MATPQYYGVTDFSPGQNNEFDPRSLMPYTRESAQMESPHCENYDITERGALVVAPGYESLISLGTGVPVKLVENFEATPDSRYLVSVSNDKLFYLRKWTNAIVHDCDAYDSVTYGTFARSGDFSSLTTTTTKQIRGSGAVQASLTGSTGQGKLTVASLTSVDISAYTSIEVFIYFSNVHKVDTTYGITNLKVRVGSSASDYYEETFTGNANGDTQFGEFWNGLKLVIADADVTGSPDLTAVTFLEIEMNHAATLDSTTIYLDDIRAVKSADDYAVVEMSTSPYWTNSYDATSIVNATPFKGKGGMNKLMIGNSNQELLAVYSVGDGMLAFEEPGAFLTNSYILTSAVGFLFVANGRTVYYSDPEDETVQAGSIGFNGNITALAPTVNKTVLVTLDTGDTQEISFSFDESTFTYTPVKGEYQAGIGGLSHKSVKRRYNDTIFLGTEGVAYFGEQEEIASGNYRVNSLSWKIDPLIRRMNDAEGQVAAGFTNRNKKEYGISLPIGPTAITNNATFIYKSRYNSWLYRSGLAISHATEYREDDDYELYFGTPNSDKIYKFAEVYDYDGDSYRRRYKTKIFDMGLPLLHKRVPFIELGGAMPKGCEFYVIARVDGAVKTFKVDDTALIVDSFTGGYIGDDYYGDEYFGGLTPSISAYEFFRFYQRIPLPREIVEGMEFQFEFYYEGTGRPHKIDMFAFKYEVQPEAKVPDRHINNNVVDNLFIS